MFFNNWVDINKVHILQFHKDVTPTLEQKWVGCPKFMLRYVTVFTEVINAMGNLITTNVQSNLQMKIKLL